MDHIEVPVDVGTIVEIAISEQIEPVLQDFVGFEHCVFDRFRQVRFNQTYALRQVARSEEELRIAVGSREHLSLGQTPSPVKSVVPAFSQFLGHTCSQLIPTGSREPTDDFPKGQDH